MSEGTGRITVMNITPATVASARTARLVREASTPVYTTVTPAPKAREHRMAVEIDSDFGRFWSHMPESEVDAFCDLYPGDLSDIDHSTSCWCQ